MHALASIPWHALLAAFAVALTVASTLVGTWNRLPDATRMANPRLGHAIAAVAALLPVAQAFVRSLAGMVSGVPVTSLPPPDPRDARIAALAARVVELEAAAQGRPTAVPPVPTMAPP